VVSKLVNIVTSYFFFFKIDCCLMILL